MILDLSGIQEYIEQIVEKIYVGDVKKGTLTVHDYLAIVLNNADFYLVLNQAVLPAATQTVDEAILVDLITQQYHLLEKKIPYCWSSCRLLF